MHSTGASPTIFVWPWDQFEKKTEATSPFGWVADVDPSFNKNDVMLIDLSEELATRAGRKKLPQVREIIRRWQEDNYYSFVSAFSEKLRRIIAQQDNWDGKGSLGPNINAVSTARMTLEGFLDAVITNGRIWKTPFVSSNEDGNITIQWNSGQHELHVEISDDCAEYTKVWGVNITHEMHVGILKEKDFLSLWDWLHE